MRKQILMLSLTALLLATPHVQAQEISFPRTEDHVNYEISSEAWVTTKTAKVTVSVEAAVSGRNAGTMRAEMAKAVDSIAKADWRLTSFNRSQDQTGMERWSTSYEARVPESDLNGLNDAAKKVSKAGMQVTIGNVDFTPTLEETEAARASLRTQLYKNIADQLTSLNATLPGRTYRIGSIQFSNGGMPVVRPMMMAKAMASPASDGGNDGSMEQSEKVTIMAHVSFAAVAPVSNKP